MPEHKHEFLPYFKDDARLRETMRREMQAIIKRPTMNGLTEAHRKEMIEALNPVIRPRSLLSEPPPPMISSSAAAFLESGLGRSCATATGSWDVAYAGGKTQKRMQLSGLKSRSELNGLVCEVVDANPDRAGRVTVRLSDSPGAPTGKLMRIRSSRLSEGLGGAAGGRSPQPQKSMSLGELGTSGSATIRSQPLPVPKCRRSFSRKPGGGYFNHSFGVELYNSPYV
mmetsp:Transcript_24424/g.66680  ORF Transcript_24424/g.66680 Transcript_24424/m.66680 type:complete len:226 (-) Transcript_24424:25-702(-)